MTSSQIPPSDPVLVAPETWLIPNLAAAGPGRFLPVNSMLVRGSEPIIVDTGAPIIVCGGWSRCFRWSTRRTCAGSSCPTTTATTSEGSPTPWPCAPRRPW